MTKINITNEVTIEAKGNRRRKSSCPTLDLTTGILYARQADVAEAIGTHWTAVSAALRPAAKVRIVKGHVLCRLDRANESLGDIIKELHNAKEKAAKYDAIMEEKYAAEREAEERRKAEEAHQKKLEKARAAVERSRAALQSYERRVADSQRKLTQAMAALSSLENIAL